MVIMILQIISYWLHALIYVWVLRLVLGNNTKKGMKIKTVLVTISIAGIQFGALSYDSYLSKSVLPVLIMSALFIFGIIGKNKHSFLGTTKAVMISYIITMLIDIVLGFVCGVCVTIGGQKLSVPLKYVVISLFRSIVFWMMWKKFEWLQVQLEKIVVNIIIILGAFLLFFQQLLCVAFSKNNYYFVDVFFLLVYITMIFSTLMNLQHRHLTADNQRILDDNQRMSQEIHRSRDVIDVVSRVVATEDTIDPKLRQELADFCKSEKQEMFDPDLAASLIGDTGMDLLNALLRDKLCQCRQQEISFEVMIPGPIDTYVSDIGIGEAELLRVINDLVKNAVTAINKTDGEVREILLILAVGPSDCLELCVYDSGVPFPDFILERFGERGNTTTGTGNGLADTVNTLRTYDASIEIEAIDPGTDIYTKCVRICFDGKNEIHI